MKVFNRGSEVAAQTLLPVVAPKSDKVQSSAGAPSKDVSSIDPQDPQGFSRLLDDGYASNATNSGSGGDRGRAAQKSARSDRADAATRALSKTGDSGKQLGLSDSRSDRSGSVSASDLRADAQDAAANAAQGDTSVAVVSSKDSPKDSPKLESKQQSDSGLVSDSGPLPLDPRLLQTPAELALEAAAIAAAQLLAAQPAVQTVAVSPETSGVSDVGVQGGSQAGSSPSQPSGVLSFADQLALRTLQASFRPEIATQPAVPSDIASFAAQNSSAAVVQNGPKSAAAPSLAPLLQNALAQQVAADSSQGEAGLAVGAVVSEGNPATSLPVDASMVSLSATSAQADALATAGRQLVAPTANGVSLSAKGDGTENQAGIGALNQEAPVVAPTQSASVSAKVEAEVEANVLAKVDAKVGGEIFASQTTVSLEKGVTKDSVGETTASQPTQPLTSVAVTGTSLQKDASNSSGNGHSNGSDAQNSKDQGSVQVQVIPVKVSQLQNSRLSALTSKPAAASGTLGANEKGVLKDVTALSVPTLEETAPAKNQDAVLNASADKALLAQVPSPVVDGVRTLSEVNSKPAVLPPVVVKGNEVWKVVSDALQRARSENPSHLAVEIRMEDGSTLGLEVRMSNAGLQASFRSESHALLKSLEAQWTGFVAKESPDAKVTAAVFESRSGFGNSTETSSNGGERRQQMEDSAASASLSRGSISGRSGQAPETAPKQITPSIRTRDGRMAVYA